MPSLLQYGHLEFNETARESRWVNDPYAGATATQATRVFCNRSTGPLSVILGSMAFTVLPVCCLQGQFHRSSWPMLVGFDLAVQPTGSRTGTGRVVLSNGHARQGGGWAGRGASRRRCRGDGVGSVCTVDTASEFSWLRDAFWGSTISKRGRAQPGLGLRPDLIAANGVAGAGSERRPNRASSSALSPAPAASRAQRRPHPLTSWAASSVC